MAINLKVPIFLLGNVRSGTSMMHDFFDLHPDVKSWYEPRTIWVYADPKRKHDLFTEEDATPRVINYIRNRFLKFQKRHDNLRIMEKTPSNIFRIPYVRKIFPEAKFLYLVREPLAYLSSSELKWRVPISMSHTFARLLESPTSQLHLYLGRFIKDNFCSRVLRKKHVSVWGVRYEGIYDDLTKLSAEQVIAKQWSACSRQATKDLAGIPAQNLLQIRYEDFVADPVPNFKQICEHFDLPLTDELIQHVDKEVDPNRQTKWQRFDPKVIADCLPYLEQEMKVHGYSVPDMLAEKIAEL